MNNLIHLDTFSGYGGFTLFAEQLGIKTIGFSEIENDANKLLRYRFPEIKNYGDITQIDTGTLPYFNLLTGGSPCQDLSQAGKRKGLDGDRSGLFFAFTKILKECEPDYFIWENVRGALSSNGGRDFARVQMEFSKVGYNFQWQLLNARDFGIPQNRERIFVIGSHRKINRPNIFPFKPIRSKFTNKTVGKREWISARSYTSTLVTSPVRSASVYVVNVPKDKEMFEIQDGVRLKRLQMLELMNYPVRKLTVNEYELLMGLPKDWTKFGINDKGQQVNISTTARYKMCGNGIVPQKSKFVYEQLLEHINDNNSNRT
ncbi:MAG: DNA cytosine methylase [Candidatus Diapherotrites archaeon ADurb.Bin253]|nr:MAG: DNA cytosine methylase [Candidatus Diapherotrites archaeon ADurb.Bin253]